MGVDKLYLYSTDWGDGPELIGEIIKNGYEYSFAYANPDAVKWYQLIKPYKDTRKVYGTDAVRALFRRLIPEKDDFYTPGYLSQYAMAEYDEWELLTRFIEDSHISFGKADCTGNVYWATKPSSY
jgi:hypothetical protein